MASSSPPPGGFRLAPVGGDSGWNPSLAGLYPNAVWARAAETMTRELLGSSAGQPLLTLNVARPPLHHGDAEGSLEIADLHRQRRLRHGTGLGGAAEMAVFGERREITKLSKRNHPDQIN